MDTTPRLVGSQTGPVPTDRRLASVDALRGLAALAVVAAHIPHFVLIPGHWNGFLFLPAHYGIKGVVLFLVISGFCIHLGTARRAARGGGLSCNWAAFWRRRFFRLYPPYLAAIAFSLLVMVSIWWRGPTFHAYSDGKVSLVGDLLTHVLMIHNLFFDYSLGLGNGAFWTLGLEEQLYALYAVYLVLRSWLPAARTFAISAAVTFLWFLGAGIIPAFLERPLLLVWFNWPFGYWAIWVLGALAAEAAAGVIRLPWWCYSRAMLLVFGALGVAWYPHLLGFLRVPQCLLAWWGPENPALKAMNDFWFMNRLSDFAFAVAFFVLINRWTDTEARGVPAGTLRQWLARVGVMSYSLYLVHIPVLAVAETLFDACSIGHNLVGIPLRYLVCVPLCLVVAAAFFRLVESRFLNTFRAPSALPAVPLRQAA
jgi:peptidoglycan/LPS O-acetylase OafA/YrhL